MAGVSKKGTEGNMSLWLYSDPSTALTTAACRNLAGHTKSAAHWIVGSLAVFASANAKKTANNGGHPEGATQIGLLEPVCIGFTIQASVHICQESSCPSAIMPYGFKPHGGGMRFFSPHLVLTSQHGVLRLLEGLRYFYPLQL